MTAVIALRPTRAGHLARVFANLGLGALLATQAVTAVVALGWLTRRMGWAVRSRQGSAEDAPGWLLGPRERGRTARLLGGLSANIRVGVTTLVALAVWTAPFTALWLGAWWAGWENSFNKGYEQAAVGPFLFLSGVAVSAIILPLIPVMLAHLATEDRLSAAFELRRIRSVAAQSGWRLAGMALVTLVLSLPVLAGHMAMATAPAIIPGLEDMTPEQVQALAFWLSLALSAVAFAGLWIQRHLAARLYAGSSIRAAGLRPGLWDGSQAANAAVPARAPSRLASLFWRSLAAGLALGLAGQILVAQFFVHAWWRWATHPAFGLPWTG